METISNTLFWISNGLLVPVVVLLLLFFLRAIILAGGFFGEFYQDYEEALAALVMLGFGKAAADKVVKIVARENPGASVEDLVRMSLKRL